MAQRIRPGAVSSLAVVLALTPVAATSLLSCAARPGVPFGVQMRPAEAHHLRAVPFYEDDTEQGGPAMLASLLTYWGFRTDPALLKEELAVSRRGMTTGPVLSSSSPLDLERAAQARGLRVQSYSGTLENVKTELKGGHPLMALLDLGSLRNASLGPLQHPAASRYVLVVGYDDARQGVYLHAPWQADTFVPYIQFLRGWERSGRWVLLILPPALQGRNRI